MEIGNGKENEMVSETEVVAKVLQFAKLELKYLNPNVQQVYFSQQLQSDNLKLVELNTSVIQHVENGGKLIIKGNDTDNCVLCTDDKTFEVKDTEISNSLLLVPELKVVVERDTYSGDISLDRADVAAVSYNYLELRPIRPKVNSLTALLSLSIYDGPEHEQNVMEKYTLDDLLSTIAASDQEILESLKNINVVELDGFMRLVDFDYLSRVIGSVTSLLDEHSWQFDSFSRKKTFEDLDSIYPKAVVDYVLNSYGSANSRESPDNWSLNEDKVCRYFAEMLLRPTQKFNLQEFLDAWRESVPGGMVTSLTQVSGMAFVDASNEPAVIRYFPVEQLSEDVKTRFEQLFSAKDSWTLDEITPYVEPMCIGKLTVSVLVMKNARGFNKGGVKHYTSKYIKS